MTTPKSNPNEQEPAYGHSLAYPGLTKLELATLMAMQGLCANHDYASATEACLALSAKNIARAALSELAKEDKP